MANTPKDGKTLKDLAPKLASYLDESSVSIYFAECEMDMYGGQLVEGEKNFLIMERNVSNGEFKRKIGNIKEYKNSGIHDLTFFGIVPGYKSPTGEGRIVLQYFENRKEDAHRTDNHPFQHFP
jgi:hypothetical protein